MVYSNAESYSVFTLNYKNQFRCSAAKEVKKVTTNTLQRMKANGEKISMLTAYDFSLPASLMVPVLMANIVGDSAQQCNGWS